MNRTMPELSQQLWTITKALQSGLKNAGLDIGATNSAVTPVLMKGNIPEATNVIVDLRENHGIFCSIVVYPVVPKDVILLRLIPTAVHTIDDVNYTVQHFKTVQEKLNAGAYRAEKILDMK
jgi:glycine C-acetyltransferase